MRHCDVGEAIAMTTRALCPDALTTRSEWPAKIGWPEKSGQPSSMLMPVRRHQRGQSLVEFAFTIGSFLLVLFGALSTALYAVQRSAAVTAAAAGVRVAASAQSGSANDADLAAAAPLVSVRLRPVLFGSTLVAKPAGTPCDPLDSIPSGQLQVCSTVDPANASMVRVVVRGRPRNLLPLVPLPWTINAPAAMHRVTFQR
jgi:Flp pilus assembly protein TadG